MIVAGATLAVFLAVLVLVRGAGTRDMALLYSGLDETAAGQVVAALEQGGATYEVRGTAIYVPSSERDLLRMSLAGQGLPAGGAQGYELLDGLSGFGTTSQMFDAAYWRAKEGELARTILSGPGVRAARVHISTPASRPFARETRPTAAVTVTMAQGAVSEIQARAIRHLVASAVAGLLVADVAVIDSSAGLVGGDEDSPSARSDGRAEELAQRAERILEARVGPGNAVVEVSLDTVLETETVTERVIDPESRIAISTETSERTNTANDSSGGDVTVASNLPSGDAADPSRNSSSEALENRTTTNYEISQTERSILREPGAVRRLTVAVLVNEPLVDDGSGTLVPAQRSAEELAALSDLVASAVGLDPSRGDAITLKSLSFEPRPEQGTLVQDSGLPLDVMALARLGIAGLVALGLGLFVLRPILTSRAPNGEDTSDLLDTSGPAAPAIRIAPPVDLSDPVEDPVTRLRKLIEERQGETVQLLRSWVEDSEPAGGRS